MNWFKKKPTAEPKITPISDHDINLLMLMKDSALSDYMLGKITAREFIDLNANIELIGLKLSEKHISALEETVHG